ncbi:MAG: hypothetical protein ACOX1P_23015 [Thermoguttaceae bacterium]|jgi:hypothetical protein
MKQQDIDAMLVALNNIAEVLQAMAADIADILVTIQAMHLDTLTGKSPMGDTEDSA